MQEVPHRPCGNCLLEIFFIIFFQVSTSISANWKCRAYSSSHLCEYFTRKVIFVMFELSLATKIYEHAVKIYSTHIPAKLKNCFSCFFQYKIDMRCGKHGIVIRVNDEPKFTYTADENLFVRQQLIVYQQSCFLLFFFYLFSFFSAMLKLKSSVAFR